MREFTEEVVKTRPAERKLLIWKTVSLCGGIREREDLPQHCTFAQLLLRR